MNMPPETMHTPTAQPERLQVRPNVHCQRCGYELRGLRADGRCPECGLEIWSTVQHLIDPTASRLPKLRDPVGVGHALFWLLFCGFIAGLALAGHAVSIRAGMLPNVYSQLGGFTLPQDLLFIASMAALAAQWSVFRFTPPRGDDEGDIAVRRDIRLLGMGLLVFSATALVQWMFERTWSAALIGSSDWTVAASRSIALLVMALAAVPGFVGIQGILQTIGRRSREYRRARGARQGARPMIVACLGIAIGCGCRLLAILLTGGWTWLRDIGTVLVGVSTLMVLIGLAYLLVNGWWIQRALRRPPPPIDEVLAPVPDQR